jgi:serine/threonine protein kinase
MIPPENSEADSSAPQGTPTSTAPPPGHTVPGTEEPSTQPLPTLLLGGEEVAIPPGLQDHPRYRLIRVIGRGGMGEVFLAEHRLMGRSVVLKTIRVDCADHPALWERFLREVRASAKLNHPNIVTVYDAEHTADTLFLVMEYLEGEDLHKLVQRAGPLDVPTACAIVRQATAGVKHAHDRGIIHRDIKPSNLMLLRGVGSVGPGLVKVLDFGLAKILHDEGVYRPGTPSGFGMGTAGFMCPEQAVDAASVGVQADIFSLGRTLCYLLSGTIPSPQRAGGPVLEEPDADTVVPLDQLCPGVPTEVMRVIGLMTASRAEDRFQSCEEVLRALAGV